MVKLVPLFVVVPLVELYLLLLLGSRLGFWPTVAVVLGTGVAGAWLAKREGLRVLREWQVSLSEGRMPEAGVLGGVLLLAGGLLLLTPGVLTDLVGLLLLVPASRAWIARWLGPRIAQRIARGIESGSIRVVHSHGGPRVSGDDWDAPPERRAPDDRDGARTVIDVEATEIDRDG